MKFKHRNGWLEGKIDVNGTKYEIEDGVFTIEDVSEATMTLLKRNGHMPVQKTPDLAEDALTEVNGVGPSRADDIMDDFETAEDMFAAGPEAIADEVDGIDVGKAEEILDVLRGA